MRPLVMQPIMLAVGVFAAACSDQTSSLPTSPVSAEVTSSSRQSRSTAELPLRGSFTASDAATIVPPTLFTVGRGEGHGTQLGRFTLAVTETVNMATATGTGTFNLTAANGDQLFATTAGGEDQFTPPNVSHVTLVATIVGGTGRFAAATGTFIIERIGTIDFATATSTSVGSFTGYITLND